MSLVQSRAPTWHWPKWYLVPVFALIFVLGVAVGNGHTTYHAVIEAKQEAKGDCHWLLRTGQWRPNHTLQRQ